MRLETISFVTFDEGDGYIPQLLRESTHGLGLLRYAPDILARLALEHGIGRPSRNEDTDDLEPDFDEAKKLCVEMQSSFGPFPLPLLEKVLAIHEAVALVCARTIENVHSVEVNSSDAEAARLGAVRIKLREKEIDQARNGANFLSRVISKAREHLMERETIREIDSWA